MKCKLTPAQMKMSHIKKLSLLSREPENVDRAEFTTLEGCKITKLPSLSSCLHSQRFRLDLFNSSTDADRHSRRRENKDLQQTLETLEVCKC